MCKPHTSQPLFYTWFNTSFLAPGADMHAVNKAELDRVRRPGVLGLCNMMAVVLLVVF